MSDLQTRMAGLSDQKRALLEKLLAQKRQSAVEPDVISRRQHMATALSFAQQRLWFLDQLAPGSPVYNIPMALSLSGSLQVEVLQRALSEIVRRHEALRTTFGVDADGAPVQIITPPQALTLSIIDLRGPDGTAPHERVMQLYRTEGLRSFDLATGPLYRFGLWRIAEAEHVLFFNVHHIVFDGWSFAVFMQELATLYEAFASGQLSPLSDLPIQYADYAVWQRAWLEREAQQSHLNYWKEHLRGVTGVLELPSTLPHRATQSLKGATYRHRFPMRLVEGLREVGRKEGATLSMTAMAAFKALIYRYTGQEDFIVGTVSANRNRVEIENLLGFFVNTLPIRGDLSGNPTFRTLLKRVRKSMMDGFAHQDVPFEKIVELAQVPREAERAPLTQVVFVLQNMPSGLPTFGGLTLKMLEAPDFGLAKFDLGLALTETDDGLLAEIEYSTDLFDAAHIERMMGHLGLIFEGAVKDPDRHLSDLPLLTSAEQQMMLVQWNQTEREYPHQPVHQLFEEQAGRTPDALAATFEDQQLTYRELNQMANRLAHALQSKGVGPGVIVGICLHRSLEMLASVLGVIKAGGAYVPLDPTYPRERLAFMLADTKAPVVLTQRELLELLPQDQVEAICVDESWPEGSEENPVSGVDPDHLIYVIYTSGSTGRPKGVLIPHLPVTQYVTGIIELFKMTATDRVLQFASLGFDLSVLEIFTALLVGASIHLTPREEMMSPESLAAVLRTRRITIAVPAPAMLAVTAADNLPDLRIVYTGGEAFSGDVVNRWSQGRQFFAGYGPTEATIVVASVECEGTYTNSPPIGRILSNHQAYVLDRHMNPVPIGIPGELYIGGVGVGWGYLNRPDLTAERFVPSPFGNNYGARLYKTGDIVYYLPDGLMQFVGRVDKQVKLRGFRIELGEIETVLATHPAVTYALLMIREDLPGGKGLVAYVVAEATPAELRDFLSAHLPPHMIPSVFMMVESMPLLPNGKIDTRSLPAPSFDQTARQASYVGPRTLLEEHVTAVFAEVLGVSGVGIHDSFFDLGGNSLQAARFMTRLQKEVGIRLPLRTLLVSPTVAGLAEAIEKERGTEQGEHKRTPLVQIRSGSKQPLFLVHPVGGNVFSYTDLARHLGPEQPLYAFEAPGLEGDQEPYTSIEALAAHYVLAMRSAHPEGPYQLGGWSMGGLIAFEMARMLHAQGERVSTLILIDTYPAERIEVPAEHEIALEFATDLAGLVGREFPPLGEQLHMLGPDQQAEMIWEQAREAGILPPGIELAQFRHRLQIFRAHVQAIGRYRTQRYAGPAVLIRAQDGLQQGIPDDLDWSSRTTELRLEVIPGNHYTILTEPNVQMLARELRLYLD